MPRLAPLDLYYLAVIGLIRLNDALQSAAFASALAQTLGLVAYFLSVHKKRQMRTNLETAFGKRMDSANLAHIERASFTDFWREMLSWSCGDQVLPPPASLEISGLEHLKTALAAGNGVILWDSNGFGQRQVAKKILYRVGLTVNQIHGPNHLGGFLTNNPTATRARRDWVKPFFDRREREFVASQIDLPAADSMASTRTMRDCLNANGILCTAGDGRVGYKQISLDFLNQPTLFSTGLVSMARLTGAVILTIFCYTQNEKTRLHIGAPLSVPQDMERDAAQRAVLEQYAERLESLIREFPEQYRNWHLTGTR